MRQLKLPALLVLSLLCASMSGNDKGSGSVTSGTSGGIDTLLSAREAFVDLPVTELDLLTRSRRLDMLDYFDADSLWQATNTYGGPSVLRRVEPSYLSVELTPVSNLQICILPLEGKATEPIVMTLYTIGSQKESPDTQMNFYDSGMKKLETEKFFRAPELKDFFSIPKGASVKMKELEEAVAFPTIAYTGVAGKPYKLEGKLTIDTYLSQEAKELIKPYLRDTLTWYWTGKKWVCETKR